MRVRLKKPHWLLRILSCYGTIMRKDRWADYYIVRLDLPALYRDIDVEWLWEIVESEENMEVVQ